MEVLEHITPPPKRTRLWHWFREHARSRMALAWLALIAFTDTLFSPITAEAFLTALMLAHRDRWRAYLPVALAFSVLGTVTGYWLFYFLYRSFGEALLATFAGNAVVRYAGDEFIAILPAGVEPMAAVAALRARLSEAPAVGFSVGVAALAPGADLRAVLSEADAGMYRDKQDRAGAVMA